MLILILSSAIIAAVFRSADSLRLLNNLRRDLYANLSRPFLAVLAVVIVKVFHMAPASVLLTPLALAGVPPKSRQMSVRSNYCHFLE